MQELRYSVSTSLVRSARNLAPPSVARIANSVRDSVVATRVGLRMAQQQERLRPRFLIIGAMKAGTTALFGYLDASIYLVNFASL